MTTGVLPQLKDVDIDPKGVFKYILVAVTRTDRENIVKKFIVRGYTDCPYHGKIFFEI